MEHSEEEKEPHRDVGQPTPTTPHNIPAEEPDIGQDTTHHRPKPAYDPDIANLLCEALGIDLPIIKQLRLYPLTRDSLSISRCLVWPGDLLRKNISPAISHFRVFEDLTFIFFKKRVRKSTLMNLFPGRTCFVIASRMQNQSLDAYIGGRRIALERGRQIRENTPMKFTMRSVYSAFLNMAAGTRPNIPTVVDNSISNSPEANIQLQEEQDKHGEKDMHIEYPQLKHRQFKIIVLARLVAGESLGDILTNVLAEGKDEFAEFIFDRFREFENVIPHLNKGFRGPQMYIPRD